MKIEHKNGKILVQQCNTLIATLTLTGANNDIAAFLKKVRDKAKEVCFGHCYHNFLLSNGGRISFKGDEEILTVLVEHPICSWESAYLPLSLHLEALGYVVSHLQK